MNCLFAIKGVNLMKKNDAFEMLKNSGIDKKNY